MRHIDTQTTTPCMYSTVNRFKTEKSEELYIYQVIREGTAWGHEQAKVRLCRHLEWSRTHISRPYLLLHLFRPFSSRTLSSSHGSLNAFMVSSICFTNASCSLAKTFHISNKGLLIFHYSKMFIGGGQCKDKCK